MKEVNVMELAWKIYKMTPLTTRFSFALKYAWKIVKQGIVSIKDGILELNSKVPFDIGVKKFRRKTLVIIDKYHMNLFLYQLNHSIQ